MREGGTISHQHGVGKDHALYLAAEKGERGILALQAMVDHFDPDGALDFGQFAGGAGAVSREESLARLHDGPPLDVLVVGGGISGASVALECARAGVRTALVEARDFASGTSSRSSKLVHGGLRYLAQGDIRLTRESVRERTELLRAAPGLVQPLGFLLPVRAGDKYGRWVLGIGLAAYDVFAGARTRRWHDAASLLEHAPILSPSGLKGGWSYLDAETDDARLVLRVLVEARRFGALTLNYLAAETLLRGPNGVEGAALRDRVGGETFEVKARCVVNAAGVWADRLRRQIGAKPKLRPLRGSHLLFEAWRFPLAQAVALFHPDDRRPIFAVPWEGSTLIGTTDVDHREDSRFGAGDHARRIRLRPESRAIGVPGARARRGRRRLDLVGREAGYRLGRRRRSVEGEARPSHPRRGRADYGHRREADDFPFERSRNAETGGRTRSRIDERAPGRASVRPAGGCDGRRLA